jgi:tetratricopeptide (TPR) repeat protein
MLSPKKKLSKKEIKQDGLLNAYAQTSNFYYENKKLVSYILTAVVAVVVVSLVFINNRRANNEKAAAEFGKVFSLYDQGASNTLQYKAAIDGQPERGIMGLKAIVDNYGGTEAGNLARFYLASAYYALGQYDEALKNFNDYSGSNALLSASALSGMGGCYEAKGENAKAASYYEKAFNTSTKSMNAPEYLNSAARCYGLSGEKEKAVTLFKRLKKDYPTSTYAREVDRYISQFSA